MKRRSSYLKRLSLLSMLFLGICSMTLAQRTITGTITDGTGEGLIGANVLVVGTDTGSATDIDGSYSVDVPDGATQLEVSYTGYATQILTIGASNVMDVVMAEGDYLEEVVVTGYGTQKAKEVTGSIVSVSAEDFNAGNISSPAQLLQGKVAGLTITAPGGDPNGSFGIRLRGLSTIGAQTDPLIIIDGVPGGSLGNIDPNDIASIDVLKDGSASAIYGTRGSSGVILITTKKGTAGVTSITYSGQVSTESVARSVDIADAAEFRAVGGNDAGTTTDWFDEITRNGLGHNHSVSMSGGTKSTSYRASINFRDREGILDNTGFNQLNGSVALNTKAIDDRLSVTVNLLSTNRKSDFGYTQAFEQATTLNPTQAVRNADGTFLETRGFNVFNAAAINELNINDGERSEMLLNLNAAFEITDELSITGNYAKQKFNRFAGQYSPSNALFGNGENRNGVATRTTDVNFNDLYEGTLNFEKDLGKVNLKALAGLSYQEFVFEGQGATAGGYLLDNNTYNQIGASAEINTGNTGNVNVYSYKNSYKLAAQFARVSLNVDDTYFMSASLRREGSDRFGEDNRWGIFPAVSAGAELTKITSINNFDQLKVRVGYGVTGNLPGDNYLALSQFNPQAAFFFNGGFVPSYGPTLNANPELKWESKTEINFGVDFAMFDYRLTGALDIFTRTTDDLILSVQVPVPPNLAPVTNVNAAAFQTSGVELSVGYDLIRKENFTYSPNLIFTSYKTNLEEYIADDVFITNLGAPGQNITEANKGLHLLQQGAPLGQIVAPIYSGLAADGSALTIDQETGNPEAASDNTFEDFVVVGNGLSDFELSLNNNFTMGKFDLNLFFRGAFGHSIVNTNRVFYEVFPDIVGQNFVQTDLANPGLKTATYLDTHVEKGDFLRLDNASLGYTLDLPETSAFKDIRFSIAAQNLFTITGYSGIDPDVKLGDNGNPLAPGVERRNNYFTSRTVTFGVNVGF